jgi:peptide/nickel transport system ATP-binding protein
MGKLLEIRDLQTSFNTDGGKVRAVDHVSLTINEGEVVGLVGESGCGKTAVSLSILQLLPTPPASIDGGEIIFNGRNLLDLKQEELRRIRGNEIAMIFQEPMTSSTPSSPSATS